MKKDSFLVALLVENHYGVLTRIAGLFSKRGFNIDSLTVSESQIPGLSRMTIVVSGDDYVRDQVTKQLAKLVDVKTVQLMEPDSTVVRELMLVKVAVTAANRAEVTEAANVFRGKIVDLGPDYMSVEITGEVGKLDAFLEYMRGIGVVEMCRTGVTAVGRGEYCLSCSEVEATENT